jgi:NTP pyrophosphatase (non-canonical NTP hydrolase)
MKKSIKNIWNPSGLGRPVTQKELEKFRKVLMKKSGGYLMSLIHKLKAEQGSMTIDRLCVESMAQAIRKGWAKKTKNGYKDRDFLNLLMLVVTELAEAVEEYRNGHPTNLIYFKDGKPEGIPIEIADVFIRLGNICIEKNIPIDFAIKMKLAYNESRPYRHGGKKA